MPNQDILDELLRRFSGATPEMLRRVLSPYRLSITSIDQTVQKSAGGREFVTFEASVPTDVWSTLEAGVSGKVVPHEFVHASGSWREIVKARIYTCANGKATGELHLAGAGRFTAALAVVKLGDVIEIDPFGVTSKIESALTEAAFFQIATDAAWSVTRMPENVAMLLGTQNYHDFRLEKGAEVVRIELKSLWGTDTTQCRLIHTKSREGNTGKNAKREDRQEWRTSSCRFEDQDIFAVSMWLRTGRIVDFAYALSVPTAIDAALGLKATKAYPEHVVQNIAIADPPSGAWTTKLEEAVERLRTLRGKRPRLAEEIRTLR